MTTKDNWIKALEEWIKTQHGSAGWEMKLENFISQVEHDAIEKTKKKIKLQESRQRYKAWLICQSINRTGVKEIDDKLDLIARTVLPEEYQHDK